MVNLEQTDKIQDALLRPTQFLALHIGESKSNKSYGGDSVRTKDSEFWFFQVADKVNLRQSPVLLRDEDGSKKGPIPANTGVDYGQLFDSNGDDIIRNDEEEWRVYHYSLGVKQDNIRVYPRVPENQNGGGFAYLTGSEPDPTTPDRFGYVPSENLSLENPSVELEALAWEHGVRSEQQYGFFNDNPFAVDPIVSVRGAAYELRPVSEQDALLNLLADIGRPPSKQQNRVHTVDFSNSALRTFSFSVPDEWKDAQNTLSISRANLPEEIEEVVGVGDVDIEEAFTG
jgi:hypothetical protein